MSCQLSAISCQLSAVGYRLWRQLAAVLFVAACAPPALAQRADTAATAIGEISRAEYAARRAALARLVRNGLIVAAASPEPELDFTEFVQNADFRYLTGLDEPDAVLLVTVRDSVAQLTLFVHDRDPEREIWVGRRLGPVSAAAQTGISARPLAQLATALDSAIAHAPRILLVGAAAGRDAAEVSANRLRSITATRPTLAIIPGGAFLAELRGDKSPAELALIRRAVAITVNAHAAAAKAIAPGRHEYEVEAALEYVFRASGAERPAFASIVGSGPNSTTLHYIRNDRRMQTGEVVVVDIGASWRGYAGDVTRTYPVSGKFTAEQRAIYQIVRDAQAAAERAATIGAPAFAMNVAAVGAISEGLAQLGLIESADATYECQGAGSRCPQYRLYYMHGLGHAIGLDVHDAGTSGVQPGRLAVGDIFSIEPGVYVRRNLLEIIPPTPRNDTLKTKVRAAVERYADIGVRIEDDYIVTPTGLEWISKFPREIEDVEAAMRD